MRAVHVSILGLIVILFLSVCNMGQAQDSLGMQFLSGLDYWHYADHIQMVGDLAYVVGISEMHIVSLSDPANPEVIGRFTWYQWSGTSGGVYVLDSVAYLGLYNGGFVLDVSDPTDPLTLGQWVSSMGMGGPISFVHNNYAVAQTDEGMPYILDVSDPTSVHRVGEFDVSGPQEGVGMAGEYLCMVGYPGGLYLYDMSNPTDPLCVASIDTTMMAHHAAISGNYAYVATLYDGLRIIDLSNPLQPVEVAACDSTDWTWDVTVTDSYMVVLKGTVSNLWLNIWNATDPVHPVLESAIPTQMVGSNIIAGSGDLVCTTKAGRFYSVMVVDISNPAVPEHVSSFGPIALLTRAVVSGTTAYLADRATGLRTVDVIDPYQMSELAHMNAIEAEGLDIATQAGYAYVPEDQWGEGTNALHVFDVSNPAQPESLGYVLPEGGRKIVIEGNYAYVAGHYLCTLDLTNPSMPQCVDSLYLNVPDDCMGLAVSDGHLYFGHISDFQVYSLSNPATPQFVGSCNLQYGWMYDLAATGRYVYVADGSGGLRVIDVGDPVHPQEVYSMMGGFAAAVTAVGNKIIMDDGIRISIYDVTDPLSPTLVGFYSTAEYIRDMEIQGRFLFIVSESQFRVYECDALSNIPPCHKEVPYEFNLLSPYPNPFNSSAALAYSIPYSGMVTLSIHNILGQRVATLFDGNQSPGIHRIAWDASNVSSGVYFAQLKSADNLKTVKMVLLK